jgi:RNA polymerase sigma-70 factor (sigma-E family)
MTGVSSSMDASLAAVTSHEPPPVEPALVIARADPEPLTGVAPLGFVTLYRERHAEMVRFATLLVGSPEVAQDLVQDCFVRLHRRFSTVRDPVSYLRRSVVNACRSHHRRAQRERAHAASERGRRGGVADLAADELGDALARLPHRQRAALVLRFYEDRTEDEIATILGCRPGTVGSLIHRGLARLRPAIEEHP